MKKILAPLLLFVMLIANAVPAYATTINNISYTCSYRAVHIRNDSQLKNFLAQTSSGSEKVALRTKSTYYKKYHQSLKVSDMSLTIEILGHVYPGKISKYLPSKYKKYLSTATAVIDCGEQSVDSNRHIWDSIAAIIENLGNPNMLDFVSPTNGELVNTSCEEAVDNIMKKQKCINPQIQLDKDIMLNVYKDIVNGNADIELVKLAMHI